MAGGGKETPRQKMVGMMYLVLTALLALQVSNAVLDKFVFIDDSLQHSVSATLSNNKLIFKKMKASVEKEGNQSEDVKVLKKAQEALDFTQEVLDVIYSLRKEMIEYTGGKDENGYKGAKDYDKIMALMIGPEGSKSGKGYKILEPKLDEFREKMMGLDDSLAIGDLTPSAKDIDEFKNNPDHNTKDFVELNFDHTPLVASLAVLSQMQQEVTMIEQKVLDHLAAKVGLAPVKFDQIFAVVSAESQVVAAGTPYKAQMFIAASSSQMTPRMTSTAGPVKVNPEGRGEIEFTVRPPSGGYDKDGKATARWKGSITIKAKGGKDTTFTVEEEYTIVKPVIKVESDVAVSLYLRCGNELSITVPALGTAYNPNFKAKGGTIINGKKLGSIIAVPSAKKMAITVFSEGNEIGTETFAVKPIPKPDVQLLSGGKPLNLKTGGPMPRSIKVKVIPDKNFAQTNPKDARYAVSKGALTLARGKRPVGNINITGSTINLGALASKGRKNDRLVIEIKGINRKNFQGKTDPVPGVYELIQYPIN